MQRHRVQQSRPRGIDGPLGLTPRSDGVMTKFISLHFLARLRPRGELTASQQQHVGDCSCWWWYLRLSPEFTIAVVQEASHSLVVEVGGAIHCFRTIQRIPPRVQINKKWPACIVNTFQANWLACPSAATGPDREGRKWNGNWSRIPSLGRATFLAFISRGDKSRAKTRRIT